MFLSRTLDAFPHLKHDLETVRLPLSEGGKRPGSEDRGSDPGIPISWNSLGSEAHCRMGIRILTGRVIVRTEMSIFHSAWPRREA